MNDHVITINGAPTDAQDLLCMGCTKPEPMRTLSRVANDLELWLCVPCKEQLVRELYGRAKALLHHHWKLSSTAHRALGTLGPYRSDLRFGRALEELDGRTHLPFGE